MDGAYINGCSSSFSKTKLVSAIYGFNPYRTVNTLHLGHKIQYVNVV